MKFDQNQLNLLKEAGLNNYESRCFLSLVVYKRLSASECSEFSGVPPTKTHETLRMLEDKGLITSTDDKPKLFQIIPIEKGLENYLVRKESSIASIRNELKDSLKKIKTIEEHETVSEKILITFKRDVQKGLALKMTRESVKELLIIRKNETVPYRLMMESKKAIERGVHIKCILTRIEGNRELIQNLKKFGYDLRFSNVLQVFMAIRDRSELLLTVRDPANVEERVCMLINDKNLAKFHANYFDSVWKDAKKI